MPLATMIEIRCRRGAARGGGRRGLWRGARRAMFYAFGVFGACIGSLGVPFPCFVVVLSQVRSGDNRSGENGASFSLSFFPFLCGLLLTTSLAAVTCATFCIFIHVLVSLFYPSFCLYRFHVLIVVGCLSDRDVVTCREAG